MEKAGEKVVAVDVRMLAMSMEEELHDLSRRRARQWRRPSICRILPRVRQEDESAYDPKIISIGPFHRDKKHLQAMEVHKWRYLHNLLARTPVSKLGKFIAGVTIRVEEIRAQYSETLDAISDEELVRMMVLDGGFIVELLIKIALGEMDPTLLAVQWVMPHIMNDLLMMENQIPYFVMETLFDAMAPRPFGFTLMELALTTMTNGAIRVLPPGFKPITSAILHWLHLFHISLVSLSSLQDEPYSCWKATRRRIQKVGKMFSYLCYLVISALMCKFPHCFPSGAESEVSPLTLPTATELREAGVRLKSRGGFKQGKMDFLMKVTFTDGTLEIPTVNLNDYTNSVLRNLVAFEQCCPENGEYCYTGYAYLMDRLIDTDQDVAVMVDAGIVLNYLGSGKEAAAFFNKLQRGVGFNVPNHYFGELFREINRYCETDHHRWRARLMRDYFNNPWSLISVVAAIVLLILTVLQTVYSIKAYYGAPV